MSLLFRLAGQNANGLNAAAVGLIESLQSSNPAGLAGLAGQSANGLMRAAGGAIEHWYHRILAGLAGQSANRIKEQSVSPIRNFAILESCWPGGAGWLAGWLALLFAGLEAKKQKV